MAETQPSGEESDEIPLALTIQQTLREEMLRDPNVVVLGEDVTFGIFGVTAGLVDEFGEDRVLDTPISENIIAGAAVGAAMTGLKPVAEIEFGARDRGVGRRLCHWLVPARI